MATLRLVFIVEMVNKVYSVLRCNVSMHVLSRSLMHTTKDKGVLVR